MARLVRIVPCAASTALLVVGCQSARFGAGASLGVRELSGSIGIDDANVRARNSVEALGLDGEAAALDARVDVVFESAARSRLVLKGFQSNHDGSGALDEEFAKGPVVIPAGAVVDSEFDAGVYSALYTFDLVGEDALEAGLGFGVAWVDLESGFTSRATGDQIFTDESVPIPLLAARLAWQGERFGIGCELAGLDVGYAGDHATFVDFDFAARWRFSGKRFGDAGELVLGWRQLYAGVDYQDDLEDVDASLSLGGPYLGLSYRF